MAWPVHMSGRSPRALATCAGGAGWLRAHRLVQALRHLKPFVRFIQWQAESWQIEHGMRDARRNGIFALLDERMCGASSASVLCARA